jgi:hypothetical protein
MFDKVMNLINLLLDKGGYQLSYVQTLVLKFVVRQVLKFVDKNKEKWKKKDEALTNLELIEKTQASPSELKAVRQHFIKESLRL